MAIILASWKEPGETAVRTAQQNYERTSSLLDALEAGLSACELDPRFLAIGLGSLPNSDGEIELDASIMDGRDLSCGAVCAVRGLVPVIKIARAVKEHTIHNMLAGDQARRYGLALGMEPQNLITEEIARRYDAWRKTKAGESEYVHAADLPLSDDHGDTVTMLGMEMTPDGPHFVAASSTSGWAWKMPGRVGDSPIVGAGIYADDEAGCAGATGLGEELWKACASYRTVQNLRQGLSAQDACEETVRYMIRRQPGAVRMPCVVLAIDRNGGTGAATTTETFELWRSRQGEIDMQTFHGLAPTVPKP